MFRAIAQGAAKEAFDTLDGILRRGVSPEQFVSDAVDYCRSVLLISYGVRKEGLLSSPQSSYETSVLQSLSSQQLEYAIGVFLDTYRHLKETVDPRFEVELAIAKLSHIGSYISPSELFDAVRSLQRSRVTPNAAPPPPASGKNRQSSEGLGASRFPDRVKDEVSQTAPLLRDLSARLKKGEQNNQESSFTENARNNDQARAAEVRMNNAEPSTPSNPSQPPSPNELRKKIISKLRGQNLFLASALEKSGEWLPKHNGYIIPVLNRVEMDLISRFSSLIAETGASILGAQCAIEVLSAKNLDEVSPTQNHGQQASISSPMPSIPTFNHEDVPDAEPASESAAPALEAKTSAPKPNEPTVEAIRKLFKGKIVASTTAAISNTAAIPAAASASPFEEPEPHPNIEPPIFSASDGDEDSEESFDTEEEYD